MQSDKPATDWTGYYQRPFVATSVTRQITTRRLIGHLTRNQATPTPKIVEWGGGNSCFIEALYQHLKPQRYTVCDTNELGLTLMRQQAIRYPGLDALRADVLLSTAQSLQADIVFSVGLIEHFDPVGTARAIESHFACAKPGGLVLISFPTPTLLYRVTRFCAESLGLWAFPDERALQFAEVRHEMAKWGSFLASELIWPIVLTQGMLVFRKR